ncbi:ead/Ea22-like family protein [Klebsiella variicola]|uniref:ead/Ea22-like family protein n=1 Tax=Klebsiella variicola TaxID=244366 RepID=UPI002377EA7E|nr:ead/Ea22-like family protein [Klebsiella variicola]MDD9248492.1 ead/Ea22-like family protein [Klebsiella variicola]
MTTDITELAQRMRTAAEKAGIEQWVNNRGEVNTADYEVDGGMYIDHICDCEIVGTESPRAEFIALANPANILALVKALEKAKGMETYWKTQCRGITDHCEELQARIAELESRTVKLPKPHAHLIWIQAGHAPDDYWDDVAVSHSEKDLCCDGSERYPVYARWEIEEMLAAAGIKVEAE